MPVEEHGGAVYLRMSPGRLVFTVFSFSMGVLAGIFLAIFPPFDSLVYRLLVLSGVLFCGAFLLAAARRLRADEPSFKADAIGLHQRVLGTILWQDVTAMSTGAGPYGPTLMVEVSDRDKYNERLPKGVRGLFYKRRPKEPFLQIPTRLFGANPEDIKAGFERVAGRSF